MEKAFFYSSGVIWILTVAAAYLLGSIPTGYLVAKAKGVDIRKLGSGNIGATNVFRNLGTPAGIFVLVADALKGYAAAAWVPVLAVSLVAEGNGGATAESGWLPIVAGVAAILGHNYTCWLRFKGGKGIATSAGVLAALVPMAFLAAVGVWILVFALSRIVSVASIAAAFSLPFATWLLGYSHRLIAIMAFLAALAIYKHKDNIKRLMQGTEGRLAKKNQPDAKP